MVLPSPRHPPPPPPPHSPQLLLRDEARDRWPLGDGGAVRHKQSGYQILAPTPAAQLDPENPPQSSDRDACCGPVTHHTRTNQYLLNSTHTHAHTHTLTPAVTLHLIMQKNIMMTCTADMMNFTEEPNSTHTNTQ